MRNKKKDFFVAPDYKDYILSAREIQVRGSVVIDNRPDLIFHFSRGSTGVCICKEGKSDPCDLPFSVWSRCMPTDWPPMTTNWQRVGTFVKFEDALRCFEQYVSFVLDVLSLDKTLPEDEDDLHLP